MSMGLVARAHKAFIESMPLDVAISNNPLLFELYKAGRMKFMGLSDRIYSPHIAPSADVVATDSSGSGMIEDTGEVSFAANVGWKTLPAEFEVTADAVDLSKNTENQAAEYYFNKFQSVAASIVNSLELQLYGDGTQSSGYAIDGLAAAVSQTPDVGTYAGISAENNPHWRNVAVDATTVPGTAGATTADNILARIRYTINKISLNGVSPTHIFLGADWYNMFEEALEKKERISTTVVETDSESKGNTAKAGFRYMHYKGLKVVNAGGLKRSSHGTYTGMPDSGLAYILDIDSIYLPYGVSHSDMSALKSHYNIEPSKVGSVEQLFLLVAAVMDDKGTMLHKKDGSLNFFGQMKFKGNLIVCDRGKQGVLFE